ncbi:glycosyltransferase family 2 protein [Desulfitibacter alkalitolerans]|uniref:glycosyltransferase family 2 protein n=1 Tax=Desulfitibacter alkalitolerans TaxID=264641 RepID=UPI00047F7B59|nr:glycosyltransferase [Desulfitibacter alkalitolerans]
MGRKNHLSLCMLIENGEKHLGTLLQVLKEAVDEIIIVDIGFSNKTIDIAKQAGASVYKMKWKKNYSEAKNFCLDMAKGRWVLFLQENETISLEQIEKIRPLLENPNVEGYLLYIDCLSKNYGISSPVQSLRLFRNRKEYGFQHRAFERIPDECLSNIKDADIRILQQAGIDLPGEAYSPGLLLEDDLQEHPADAYLQYIYGIELLNQKRYEESVVYFNSARKNVNMGCLFAPHLYKCLSWNLIVLKRFTNALEVLDEGVKYFPQYTDLLVLRAELRQQFQQHGEAIQDLKSALNIRQHHNSIVPRPEINVSVIYETLGEVHEEIFNYQQALACYQYAYDLNKSNHKLLYKIGDLVKLTNSTNELEKLLKTSVGQKNLEQLIILMEILFQQRKYYGVLEYLEYLETILGQGEQTAGIKISCHIMLGEIEKVDFSGIDKNGLFYNQILLQRIESYWCHNKWLEARELLKEMDKIESIDHPIKALYHQLHGLLTGKKAKCQSLTQQEYEIVSAVMESLLWAEQAEKAQILVSLLLQAAKEEQYIKLAEPWAERNDYHVIEKIFRRISNKAGQQQFKQKIIQRLLSHNHIKAAQRLGDLGGADELGVLAYLLWARDFMKKLEELIARAPQKTIKTDEVILQAHTKPNQALLTFYHGLNIAQKNMKKSTCEDAASEMSCAEAHMQIGDFYAGAEKKKEALSAYLRALLWEPLHYLAQEKISKFFQDNPDQIRSFLEGKRWVLEGAWFYSKDVFIEYILGVIHFKNQQFEEALAIFHKVQDDKDSYPVTLAYTIGCFWLMGKEAEAERIIRLLSQTDEVILSFFHICKNHALDKLKQGQQLYPYSELIMMENERIRAAALN